MVLIIGCSHDPASVVVKELRTPPKITRGEHIVREGETLYSIAWLYNRDFNELAQVNGIPKPHTIYPGQTLSLAAVKRKAVVYKPRSKPVKPKPVIDQQQRVVKKQSEKNNQKTKQTYSNIGWRWPSDGRIVSRYSIKAPVNKGIDINGKLGEPVRAADGGEVVYAGSELTGYGRLIILKHNSSYLSAYAHNRELFVREGDSVKAGQKIAEIGSTGTTEPKLHFEIRRNGKPVDPMGYLPKR
ncbi:peptidase M23 [Endozoicomonas sp. (ex Bugula neritina AB1)]|nr:peptidase M23 [Endozoicomonas sp. (ex Bugula neritina AB1)]